MSEEKQCDRDSVKREGRPLTLGKLILDTARGTVKQRTLNPTEAAQILRKYKCSHS